MKLTENYSLKKPDLTDIVNINDLNSNVVIIDEELKKVNDNVFNLTSQMDNKANKDDVAKISSGTPLFAESVDNMTDITKNYVNITDGYVYIYNNDRWKKTSILYQAVGITDGSVSKDSVSVSTNISINRDIYGNVISIIEIDENGTQYTTELKRDENGKISSFTQSGGKRTYETTINYNEDKISNITSKITQ